MITTEIPKNWSAERCRREAANMRRVAGGVQAQMQARGDIRLLARYEAKMQMAADYEAAGG